MDCVVFILVCLAPVAHCYSSGNVMDSCEDMKPHHSGLRPQSSPAPFTVTADRSTFSSGEEVTVQLQALGSKPFTGFLLQAREVGRQTAVGSFTLSTAAAQLLTCHLRPNSAVSHRSESLKTSIQVTWRSEALTDGKLIQFHASFVENFKTFWTGVTSPALTFTNGSSAGSTSSLPIPSITSSNTTRAAMNISSADCGVTKVCFSQPANCDPTVSPDCYFMSATVSSGGDTAVHYEMTGPSDGYISFGFSDDQMMGNDDIYICGICGDDQVWLHHAFSTGRTTPQASPLGNVSDVRASVQDTVISCSFTSRNMISTQRTKGIDRAYHLMFAHGPCSNGRIHHHRQTFISTEKIDISTPQAVGKAGLPHIIKAHGALMLIAWMTTGSLGMMVARYLKALGNGQKLCSKDVWFLVHVAVMGATVAATIVAFILSFSYVKAWSEGPHSVLGCLVMILSFLQPIIALLRCGPQHPLRFLFNWSHALNSVVIKALAVAAIFTGLKMIDSTPNQWLMKVMGGFVGWEALFYIILEVHSRWKARSTDALQPETITTVLLVALYFLGNCSYLVALLVGIGIS
ncbi:putative ferric-chelate reductase 1 isoform X2 [Solea solea]|uniref:putative ferric-chelate reductase 1 isoform X2 n=1 Tax=Solea solea TaxID=90069 RepID=UPI00272B996C|nr:putative ferric-chelate reductase 1 isoform X2 [Solea solea]